MDLKKQNAELKNNAILKGIKICFGEVSSALVLVQ